MPLYFVDYVTISRVNKTHITLPVEDTNNKVREQLKEKIKSGIYSIGETIVPQEFKCLHMKNGKPAFEIVTVYGKYT